MPLARDRRGRLMLPLHVNDRGPFSFVLDTAAGLSMVSSFLAGELQLKSTEDTRVLVQGSLGLQINNRVNIERLAVDELASGPHLLGVLDASQLAGADGLLGADCLQQHCVDLQLRSGQLALFPSDTTTARHLATTGGSRVSVERHFDTLLALQASMGRTPLRAILDTGAQRSIGNLALQRALDLRPTGAADSAAIVTGVDGSNARAEVLASPSLRLGKVSLPPAPILYADLPVFERWGYAQRPALLLGMDLLGSLGRVFVDYQRTRVLVWA